MAGSDSQDRRRAKQSTRLASLLSRPSSPADDGNDPRFLSSVLKYIRSPEVKRSKNPTSTSPTPSVSSADSSTTTASTTTASEEVPKDVSDPAQADISSLGLSYLPKSPGLGAPRPAGSPPHPHGHTHSSKPSWSSSISELSTAAGPSLSITKHASSGQVTMSQNQESFGEDPGPAGMSSQNSATAAAATATTAGVPPPAAQNLGSGPTNLSGLVCNVHRTTGREPHSLVGATTTILGDKLFVFGGRLLSRTRPELTSDLYELDLIRRHWTKLQTTGDVPPPRYFHSTCALGDSKLVCYGGMSPISAVRGPKDGPGASPQQTHSQSSSGQDSQPEVVVMSDVHILDVPTRIWTRIQTANNPQGRYAHCASILPSSGTFASTNAPLSAIHNNPASANPHQGSIGVEIDGRGGAEMVVVGGQDSSNHYIEQVSVFNLRSLRWTATTPLGRSCGAYRSVVAPLTGLSESEIGQGASGAENSQEGSTEGQQEGPAMLIYSNYNFLDVKLELQVRLPDGQLIEKTMAPQISPPGLRFPNGGVINGHFVVSGTYLTSSKQEYALWALDLKTLTWGRIDVGGSVFNHGSWNRGVLWNRRSTFVILGHRKRSLVEDYNHRRLNFSHVCFVELEAFGLHDNPRKSAPTSGYVSVSAPPIPASLQPKGPQHVAGGRPYSSAAEQLGLMAQAFPELSDMELLTIGGERIAVSSHILARRWGPYFVQMLREAATVAADQQSDTATLRPPGASGRNRNSNITITPSIGNSSQHSQASTLLNPPSSSSASSNHNHTASTSNSNNNKSGPDSSLSKFEPPSAHAVPPTHRPRTLYLPHTYLTVQLLVHYLYTSSLPQIGSPLCTPQILCSLLQLARPYHVDGLLEATVERLHQVLDGRNAAAVFNAAAMAAGGGRGTGSLAGPGGTLEMLNGAADNAANNQIDESNSNTNAAFPPLSRSHSTSDAAAGSRPSNLRINTNLSSEGQIPLRNRAESVNSASTATSASTSTSASASYPDLTQVHTAAQAQGPPQASSQTASSSSQPQAQTQGQEGGMARNKSEREVWTGEVSSVVGLQKRGLRGLMEGRRMRERGGTMGAATAGTGTGGGEEGNSAGAGGPATGVGIAAG